MKKHAAAALAAVLTAGATAYAVSGVSITENRRFDIEKYYDLSGLHRAELSELGTVNDITVQLSAGAQLIGADKGELYYSEMDTENNCTVVKRVNCTNGSINFCQSVSNDRGEVAVNYADSVYIVFTVTDSDGISECYIRETNGWQESLMEIPVTDEDIVRFGRELYYDGVYEMTVDGEVYTLPVIYVRYGSDGSTDVYEMNACGVTMFGGAPKRSGGCIEAEPYDYYASMGIAQEDFYGAPVEKYACMDADVYQKGSYRGIVRRTDESGPLGVPCLVGYVNDLGSVEWLAGSRSGTRPYDVTVTEDKLAVWGTDTVLFGNTCPMIMDIDNNSITSADGFSDRCGIYENYGRLVFAEVDANGACRIMTIE